MEFDEVVMAVHNAPVRAYRAGRGRPLVLLHGGGVDSALLTWQPAWNALTRLGSVLAADLPGFGASPLGTTVPTLAGYRDWLTAFLDAAGVARAVLVGLSLGGGIALQTALDAPQRVDGLVLCAPYGVSPQVPGGRAGFLAVHSPGLSSLTYAGLRHSDTLLRRALGALMSRPESVDAQLVQQVRALLDDRHIGEAWARFQRYEVGWRGPRTYWTTQLSALSVPVVLLSGDGDTLVPMRDLRAAADRLPHGRFESVASAGHWLPREAPAAVAAATADLLADFDTNPSPPLPRKDLT